MRVGGQGSCTGLGSGQGHHWDKVCALSVQASIVVLWSFSPVTQSPEGVPAEYSCVPGLLADIPQLLHGWYRTRLSTSYYNWTHLSSFSLPLIPSSLSVSLPPWLWVGVCGGGGRGKWKRTWIHGRAPGKVFIRSSFLIILPKVSSLPV